MFPGNLSAIKSPDATKVDISNQDHEGFHNLREKSVERKNVAQSSN
jgi:hypothetical protein